MGTLSNWMITVPALLVFGCLIFFAAFAGIALAGGSPIPPWNW